MPEKAVIQIRTFWQPKGHSYWVEQVTTLEEAETYHVEWLGAVKSGATYVDITYENVSNPGRLIVLVNVRPIS